MPKPYAELSYPGQVRRMRRVAEQAAAIHGLRDPKLTLLQHSENVVYRVDEAATGRRFALRVHRTDYHSEDELRSELAWLEALGDGGIVVPRPVRGPDGGLLVHAAGADTPTRPCSLMHWVYGRMRLANRRPRHLRILGGLLARLHNHARTWERPAWFTRKPLGWPELFTDTAVAGVDAATACRAFTSEQRAVYDAVRAALDPADLGPVDETHGLIHADLHFWNVVFDGDRALPFDFDDCAIGPWILDVATTLGAAVDDDDFGALRHALLDGYASEADQPLVHLEFLDHFLAGRFVLLALYVAASAVHDPKFDANRTRWITRFFDHARRFLDAL